VWSIGGRILTEEHERNWRKTRTSTTLSTTNPTGLGQDSGFCGENPRTVRLGQGTTGLLIEIPWRRNGGGMGGCSWMKGTEMILCKKKRVFPSDLQDTARLFFWTQLACNKTNRPELWGGSWRKGYNESVLSLYA